MHLLSKNETFAKLFFLICFTGFVLYLALAFYTFHNSTSLLALSQVSEYKSSSLNLPKPFDERKVKYILLLRNLSFYEFHPFEEGGEVFENCPKRNCFLTYNYSLLDNDITAFDAVVFNLTTRPWTMLPERRSPEQKYVFYGMSPSDGSAVCHIRAENLFNWTWTYKMSSEIFSPFFEVRDKQGNVIAPKEEVIWKTNMPPMTEDVKDIIKRKTKAVAWLVNNCQARNNRIYFALQLKAALLKHNLDFDIYGCDDKDCPNDTDAGCFDLFKRDYYFYLAYEQGFAQDYLTHEITNAVNSFTVPIVFSGADYKKFLPPGSFINARPFNVRKLAALIDHVIKHPSIYNTFHRWRSYYSFKPVDKLAGICQLCTLLNDREKFTKKRVYRNFRNWWYQGSLKEKCIPKGAESEDFFYSYLNSSVVRRG